MLECLVMTPNYHTAVKVIYKLVKFPRTLAIGLFTENLKTGAVSHLD